MPVRPSEYLDSKSGEWKTLHELICEYIEVSGIDIFYIPKEITTRDDIFGQDIGANVLSRAYKMRMSPIDFKSFKDSATLFGKMGINITDKLRLVIAQDVYEKTTGFSSGLARVSDIIYIPLLKKCEKSMWEIRSVVPFDDDKLMQFGDEHIYIFGCELLKLDATDEFRTPLPEVNQVGSFMDNLAGLEKTEVDRKMGEIAPDFDEEDPFNSNR